MKIKPPVSYQGSKTRLAKQIVDIILSQRTYDHFYDLCCGNGSISLELINRGIRPEQITMLDIGEFGLFWKKISSGQFDLVEFDKEIKLVPNNPSTIKEYLENLSKNKTLNIYQYLILQAGAFGGKQIWFDSGWKNATFRDYWLPTETSSRRYPVNPMMPMPNELFKRVETIVNSCKGITVSHSDIFEVLPIIREYDCAIYIDPPYKNTTGYFRNFNINHFLNDLFDLTLSHIFVSEGYQLGDNAICLNSGRSKGGISGKRNTPNQEWLSLFL